MEIRRKIMDEETFREMELKWCAYRIRIRETFVRQTIHKLYKSLSRLRTSVSAQPMVSFCFQNARFRFDYVNNKSQE